MEEKKTKTIVVSAVSLRKGGTLTILRDCLEFLSGWAGTAGYRVVALVHKKELAYYPNIDYLEFPDIINRWDKRLWCEYHTMYGISKRLAPVALWLSLHDTTPNVVAERRAVYCQTSFPFLKWNLNDLKFDYKIVLFALFTRFAYRVNIKKNDYLVVQAEWLRKGFAKMFGLSEQKFIVAPPKSNFQPIAKTVQKDGAYTFLYPATPDCHKNFEILCKAAQLLENEIGKNRFRVILTINGTENAYSSWIYSNWGMVDSIIFKGFMSKNDLYACYAQADCLVFPSRVETWGLPISEFAAFNKPMLLADLPYAHETSNGCKQVDFFHPEKAVALKEKMLRLINGDFSLMKQNKSRILDAPVAYSWGELFKKILGI